MCTRPCAFYTSCITQWLRNQSQSLKFLYFRQVFLSGKCLFNEKSVGRRKFCVLISSTEVIHMLKSKPKTNLKKINWWCNPNLFAGLTPLFHIFTLAASYPSQLSGKNSDWHGRGVGLIFGGEPIIQSTSLFSAWISIFVWFPLKIKTHLPFRITQHRVKCHTFLVHSAKSQYFYNVHDTSSDKMLIKMLGYGCKSQTEISGHYQRPGLPMGESTICINLNFHI